MQVGDLVKHRRQDFGVCVLTRINANGQTGTVESFCGAGRCARVVHRGQQLADWVVHRPRAEVDNEKRTASPAN